MIRYEEVVSLFMAACPELAEPWLEQCIDGDLDPTDGRALDGKLVSHPLAQPQLYHYLAFNVLLPFVMQRYESGDTSRLTVILDLIERIIEEGDPIASEWAVIGFLEDLQGEVLREHLDDATFFPWMGPKSHEAWQALHKFWGTGPAAGHTDSSPHTPGEDERTELDGE